MSIGKYITIVAALVVLAAFFLPWIVLSTPEPLEVSESLTGYDLARGTVVTEEDIRLYITPLAALVVLGLVFAGSRDLLSQSVSAAAMFLVASAGFVALWLAITDLRQAVGGAELVILLETIFGEPFVSNLLSQLFSIGYGMVATAAGLFFIAIGAVVELFAARRLIEPTYAPSPTSSTIPTMGMENMGHPATGSMPYQPYGNRWQPLTPAMETAPNLADDPSAAALGQRPSPITEVLHQQPKIMAWLVITDGFRAGHRFQLFEDTSIGRDAENDVVLDDGALSGRHARIKLEGDNFYLWDLASTNGTYYKAKGSDDWEQIYRQQIRDGDQMKVGRTALHFMTVRTGGNTETDGTAKAPRDSSSPTQEASASVSNSVNDVQDVANTSADTQSALPSSDDDTLVTSPANASIQSLSDDNTLVLP